MKGSNLTANQRRRLLEALKVEPMTTIQIRKKLDILSPAPRIMELREQGNLIVTSMVLDESRPQQMHYVALYSLLSEIEDAGLAAEANDEFKPD